MGQRLSNYLRTHRKRSSLTQKEVAFLLGLESGQIISRYERFSRMPSLKTAMAYQIIFNAMAHELFPGMYEEVEQLTIRRIQLLSRKIDKRPPDRAQLRKLRILKESIESTRSRRSRV